MLILDANEIGQFWTLRQFGNPTTDNAGSGGDAMTVSLFLRIMVCDQKKSKAVLIHPCTLALPIH